MEFLVIEIRFSARDRIPDEQDVNATCAFVDVVAGLRHQDAPDDAAAARCELAVCAISKRVDLVPAFSASPLGETHAYVVGMHVTWR